MTYVAPISNPVPLAEDGRLARVALRLRPSPFLAAPLAALGYDSRAPWARERFKALTLAYIDHCRAAGRRDGCLVRVLEVGARCGPALTFDEIRAAGAAYTVSDASGRELESVPPEFDTVRLDIDGEIAPSLRGAYDLVMSRGALTPTRRSPRVWANVAALLAPGGVALAFHPPRDWPAAVSPRIIEPVLRAAGFREALSLPFWGEGGRMGFRAANEALSAIAEAHDWRWLASSAYTLGRK